MKKNKILSSASFLVSHALSLPTLSIVHFARRDMTFAIRHKGMELKQCRKKLCKAQNLNQAATACIFLFGSKGCFVLSTLKIMTKIFRVIARSAFCDFIRLESTLYFFPRNDLPLLAVAHDISTRICLRYLFPCKVLRDCILPADSSFLGRKPDHPTKEFAFWKALMSLPISARIHNALNF